MNGHSSGLIALFATLGIALVAFGGVSQAQTVSPRGGSEGSDSPGLTDNPSDNSGNQGEFATGAPSDTAPSSQAGASLPSTDTVASKTSGSQAASLPFTGYLAIPVLLLGVAMLGTGFALRRRAVA